VLISRLSIDRFGIWSLALIILSTVTSLDASVSASLAWFFAIDAARDLRANAGRLVLGSLVFFLVFGLVLALAAIVLAPTLVELVQGFPGLVLTGVPPLIALTVLLPIERRGVSWVPTHRSSASRPRNGDRGDGSR
jgi:O-antigen/teichoic acid export membrane protein